MFIVTFLLLFVLPQTGIKPKSKLLSSYVAIVLMHNGIITPKNSFIFYSSTLKRQYQISIEKRRLLIKKILCNTMLLGENSLCGY